LVQLKAHVNKCEFGELEDSLVKDMIVLGTKIEEKDLELEKTVTICKSAEQAHKQVQKMTAE
jgi:hypothetical protein